MILSSWQFYIQRIIVALVIMIGLAISYDQVFAASLKMSPSTGVYNAGATFSVAVVVNTNNESVNAAEGTISFNPKEVSVVSVSRASSIFSLWVTEPTFSNSAGTVSFSGGSPSGYNGAGGNIMTITFRSSTAGAPRVSYASGAVLANDGKGTNVLSGMTGGTYTIQAQSAIPVAEQVIEYVAPANTTGTPNISSDTHLDPSKWYTNKTAVLSWALPAGVTEVRTLIDDRPSTVPTKVYESPIRTITLNDLDEGISYFHVQFRNKDGWGKVAHYRLAVDSQKPESFIISLPEGADSANPLQKIQLSAKDATSKVKRFIIKVNNDEAYEFNDVAETGSTTLSTLPPGYHALIVEAFDEAGNGLISTFSLTISAFEKPVFTEYPDEINDQVIPVLRGTTRSEATVEVTVKRSGAEPSTYVVTADKDGKFTFIPEGTFGIGVYEVSARATDQYGAQSETSDPIRIAVQQPGFIRIGSLLINVLTIILSLAALIALSGFAFWYLVHYLRRLRKKIVIESHEAVTILHREFEHLESVLANHESELTASRKGAKLTKAEFEMVQAMKIAITDARTRVEKEVSDVENLALGGATTGKIKK